MTTRIFGIALFAVCLANAYYNELASTDGGFQVLHWPAIVLTTLGPLGVILVTTSWANVYEAFRRVFTTDPDKQKKQLEAEQVRTESLARQIYADRSVLSELKKSELEQYSRPIRSIIEKLQARIPIADISNLLEQERLSTEIRQGQLLRIFSLGVRLSPSVGMLGTILGIVQILSHLSDPSGMGPAMSLAMLTTFYGLFVSLIFWTPLQQRLDAIHEISLWHFDRAGHWLELLQREKPPEYFTLLDNSLVDKKRHTFPELEPREQI